MFWIKISIKDISMAKSNWKLIFLAVTFLNGIHGNTTSSDLFERLFANYRPEVLPKCESDKALQLRIGIALRQIIDLNEPRQILEVNTWIRLNWYDCQLRWNATETGLTNMVVPSDRIWIPDITLYDSSISSAENTLGGLKDFRPNIYSDGSVYYNFPSIIKSICKIDVTYFPFDRQTCRMKFGSWSYHGLDLNVTSMAARGDTSAYMSNGEWSIHAIPVVRHVLKYPCCLEPYPDVTFFLQMERKSLFYVLNLLFPCVLISTMGFLGFLLPPDSGEKVSLEITVLLSLAVFLLVVSETMPPTSETFPYIGVYFACAMLLVSLSCLMTVTVLNIHFKGQFGKTMPAWVRRVFLQQLGGWLRVKVKHHDNGIAKRTSVHDNHAFVTSVDDVENNSFRSTEPILERSMSLKESSEFRELCDLSNLGRVKATEVGAANDTLSILREQVLCLRSIQSTLEEKQVQERTVEEWQRLAQVIDRVFMVLFSIFQVTTTLAIMLRSSLNDPAYVVD